jgi:hypothetical protein
MVQRYHSSTNIQRNVLLNVIEPLAHRFVAVIFIIAQMPPD